MRAHTLLGSTLLLAALSTACDSTPRYVQSSVEIDDAFARQNYKTICVGLAMQDEEIVRYASSRLSEVEDPIAAECMCENAYDATDHTWNRGALDGLEGTGRQDMVECFLPALDDPAAPDRGDLVSMLIASRGPQVKARMAVLAKNTSEDPETRAAAVGALGGTQEADQVAILVELLGGDAEASVRAAAAKALVGQKSADVEAALRKALSDDSDAGTRSAALKTLKGLKVDDADALVCTAMIEDESAEVRKAAVLSYKGTKRDTAIDCLRKKALTEEPDGEVRRALLTVLKSSPNEGAPKVLCDAIPFFMKTYITDKHPSEVPGTDIAAAQNDRDWENSYACFQGALRKTSGWSCHGKQYVRHWYKEVGGSTSVPRCAGDEGFGEVVFQ